MNNANEQVPQPADRMLPMTVHNTGFLLDRLGQDCHDLQFLRELTQNAIEAVRRVGKPGQVTWDVDWTASKRANVLKLCVTDTGDGMTGPEMVRFINQLSSSAAAQSLDGNYGVGAKIAAATRNHEGVVYVSWKHGQGNMVQLFRDPVSGHYGLKQWRRSDDSYAFYLPIKDDIKPSIIDEHGTMVVLLGNATQEDTTRPPQGSPDPSTWISRYLNTRYYRFSEHVTVRARENRQAKGQVEQKTLLRTLSGQAAYLEAHARMSGRLKVNKAVVHWWILKDEPAVANNAHFIESAGHVAALYQDELYELTAGRSGVARLQQFGITFGCRWVVIYVEPVTGAKGRLTTNTARTSLLMDNQSLPWTEWATEFRQNMPAGLDSFVQEKALKTSSSDHSNSIRQRLKHLMRLFNVSRYRQSSDGTATIDGARLVRGGAHGTPASKPSVRGSGSKGGQGGKAGNLYAVFEKEDGHPAQKTMADLFPEVRWVSISNGTRDGDDMEDRAAKYLSDQNLLLINADFRVFEDMQSSFLKSYGGKPSTVAVVQDAVRQWSEQALVETVIGVQTLANSREWTPDEIGRALSSEALTASVMQRYHVYVATKRTLSARIGAAD